MNNDIINVEPEFTKEYIKTFIETCKNIKYKLRQNRSQI